jgi:YggT family protein
VRFLSAVTDPLLSFLRRKMPFLIVGAVDLSPLVAVFIIMFARHFLVQTIFEIALRLS